MSSSLLSVIRSTGQSRKLSSIWQHLLSLPVIRYFAARFWAYTLGSTTVADQHLFPHARTHTKQLETLADLLQQHVAVEQEIASHLADLQGATDKTAEIVSSCLQSTQETLIGERE